MNALIVSVNFSDLLSQSLPYNRHHFDRVLVVSTPGDVLTMCVVRANNAELLKTNAFYANGAVFNKWLAVELGLDKLGRDGQLCLLDADIFWPKQMDLTLPRGHLYAPWRRVQEHLGPVLPESEWSSLPRQDDKEFAAYSLIFWGDDPRLTSRPWFESWRHAGGGDTFFATKWPQEQQIRPPFEVLHMGPTEANWCGRTTPYADGEVPAGAAFRKACMQQFLDGRKGKTGRRRFDHEKL